MWKLSVILLFSASVLQIIDAQDQQTVEDTQSQETTIKKESNCSENQHWKECGTRCPARCNIVGRIGIKCPNGCKRGCFCNEGYMFLSGTSGRCVLPKDCPKMVPVPSPKPTEPQCPKNQEWSECGTACPNNCENVGNKNRICPKYCKGGCVCREPLVFQSGSSGPCVLPEDCPKINPVPSPKPTEHKCLENQEWKDCGTVCPARCNIIGHMLFKCPNTCKPGCFCKEPYIFKSGTSGSCVLRKDCPKINPVTSPKPTVHKCPKNQHWEDKGTACPYNCQNVGAKIKCTADTVAGCFCDKEYVFQSGGSGPCVLIKDCPKPPENKCPKNQHWTDCGTACPSNCEGEKNPPAACIDLCVPGCFCNKGYIFQSGSSGSCVLPQDCPKTDPVPSPKPTVHKCPKNQHWEDKGTACPYNCQNVGAKIKCTADTVKGCFCDKEYVFQSGESGPCVLIKDCPKPPENKCPKNQHWTDCGTACPSNCEGEKNPPAACIDLCVPGCFCNKGYIFQSGSSGSCVPPQDCPKTDPVPSPKPTEPKCPKNQEWSECGTACPNNCENVGNKKRICPKYCKGGCVCREPLVFQSGSSGPCVLPEDCPKTDPVPSPKPTEPKCPKNQEWSECGTACPNNCENVGNKNRICPKYCKGGCVCREPLVFQSGSSGPCVLPEDCPKTDPVPSPKPTEPKCPKNQEWSDCGTACPDNCENEGKPGRICPQYCKGGCVCREPLVFQSGSSGPCVLPKDCPKIDPIPSPKPTVPKCPKNQHWEDRGTACPKNCQNKDALIKCTADTVAGCFCNEEYVFQSGDSGPCVLPKDCPKPTYGESSEEQSFT
ncbi:zonadhesin-like isoform X3 [Eleutherodactylus coqui]|uniref:zonadhesin-like isoform X3 n=1 Tax=Eleutherodactylus coqui TaxID=57060 RepID=UPI00346338C4